MSMNRGGAVPFDFRIRVCWVRESEEWQVLSVRLSEEVWIGANPVLWDYGATRAFLFGSLATGQCAQAPT